jgi:hypothetical protein
VDDLVDVTQVMFVDGQGRLVLAGRELHPCCLEAVDYGHGECTFDGFVTIPAGKNRQRTPIPVKENWCG